MKMKLSRTSWLLLIGGVFLVIVFSLGMTRSQQVKTQGQLDEELAVAGARLEKLQLESLQRQQEELLEQLDEANVQLAMAKNQLRQPVASIEVTDAFYAVARACGVTVENYSSSAIRNSKVGSIGCSLTMISASATGTTSNLIKFVIRLNGDYRTGVVRSAQVSIPENSSDDSKLSIQMAVYAYEGS